MSIRSLGIPEYKAPKDRILLGIIMRKLYTMGYFCEDEHDIVKYIDENNIDASQFEFPEGDYTKFKDNLDAGKYDVNIHWMTDEHREQLKRDLTVGKISITYWGIWYVKSFKFIINGILIVVSYINMMFDFGLRCFLNVVKYKYKSKESEDDMLCLYQN